MNGGQGYITAEEFEKEYELIQQQYDCLAAKNLEISLAIAELNQRQRALCNKKVVPSGSAVPETDKTKPLALAKLDELIEQVKLRTQYWQRGWCQRL